MQNEKELKVTINLNDITASFKDAEDFVIIGLIKDLTDTLGKRAAERRNKLNVIKATFTETESEDALPRTSDDDLFGVKTSPFKKGDKVLVEEEEIDAEILEPGETKSFVRFFDDNEEWIDNKDIKLLPIVKEEDF